MCIFFQVDEQLGCVSFHRPRGKKTEIDLMLRNFFVNQNNNSFKMFFFVSYNYVIK